MFGGPHTLRQKCKLRICQSFRSKRGAYSTLTGMRYWVYKTIDFVNSIYFWPHLSFTQDLRQKCSWSVKFFSEKSACYETVKFLKFQAFQAYQILWFF